MFNYNQPYGKTRRPSPLDAIPPIYIPKIPQGEIVVRNSLRERSVEMTMDRLNAKLQFYERGAFIRRGIEL